MATYKPMYDNILIKPIAAETKTAGGIYIPESSHNSTEFSRAEVVAIGHGRIAQDKIVPLTVKVGDKIIYRKMTEVEVKHGFDTMYILSEGSILAIEED